MRTSIQTNPRGASRVSFASTVMSSKQEGSSRRESLPTFRNVRHASYFLSVQNELVDENAKKELVDEKVQAEHVFPIHLGTSGDVTSREVSNSMNLELPTPDAVPQAQRKPSVPPMPTTPSTKPSHHRIFFSSRLTRRMNFQRLSISPATVSLNGSNVGALTIRRAESLKKLRTKLNKEIESLPDDYQFLLRGSDSNAVAFEDEAITRAENCLSEDSNLYLYSKKHEQSAAPNGSLRFPEDSLRKLSPDAEAVLRICFRILERCPNDSFKVNQGPSDVATCVKFTRDLAQATVDASIPSIVAWDLIETRMGVLEDMLHTIVRRDNVASWWFSRTDRIGLKHTISMIQTELRASSSVSESHPVYLVHFPRPNALADELLDAIGKTTPEEFLSPKHKDTRRKVAAFLRVDEEQLRRHIVHGKNDILLKGPMSLIGGQDSLKRQTSDQRSHKERGQLKDMLAPLHHLDTSLVQEHAGRFCDEIRQWAFGAFDEWVAQFRTKHRIFIMAGVSGSGKTTFASKIVRDRASRVFGYHFCRNDDERFLDAKVMLLSLVFQLSQHLPQYKRRILNLILEYKLTRKKLLSENFSIAMIFTELLEIPLREVKMKLTETYVFVIDGIDESSFGSSAKNEIIETIRNCFTRLPSWLLVFLTTKPRLPVLKKLRQFNALMIGADDHHYHEDLKIYFTHVMREKNLFDCDREALASNLAHNACGRFLYATLIDRKLVNCCGDDEANQLLVSLAPSLEGLFQQDYGEAVCAGSKDLFWKVAMLSMVAIEPLHSDIIVELVDCHCEDLKQLLSRATTFFSVRDGVVMFFHKSVKHWLLTVSGRESPRIMQSTNVSPKKGRVGAHSTEVDRCQTLFASQILGLLRTRSGSGRYAFKSNLTNEYILRYGVRHLALAGMVREAREMILDPGWLMARACEGEGIVESCEVLSEGDHVLQLLGRAVTLSLEAIRQDPRQMAGQLVGRLMAATTEGHGDEKVRKALSDFVVSIKAYDYGYQWWCPISPTWDQAEQPFLRKLIGHTGPVQCVGWHSDGTRCATGSWDQLVMIWDPLTGHCDKTLSGHTDSVWSVDWEPLGNRLVSGSLDRTIIIWRIDAGESECVLDGHTDSVWSVQWSKDGRLIASASKDKTIRIWSSIDGKCIGILNGHTGCVYSVAWEAGVGSRLCSAGTDNVIRIWNTDKMTCISVFAGHTDWVRSVFWCNNGRKKVLSASADQTVRVWDVESGECEQVLMGHSESVWSVSKSNDGRYAVSGSTDGTVRVWDCFSGRCDQVLNGHSGPVWAVSWCSDGKRVISASSDKTAVVWDCTIGRTDRALVGHSGSIWSADISSDGMALVSASADKSARLWNRSTGTCERVFAGHTGPVWSVSLSPDGRRVATGSTDNTASVYRIGTGERQLVLTGHTDSIWAVAWSVDGSRVITGSRDKTIRIWSSKAGRCVRLLEGHDKDVRGLSVHPDGRQFASCSTDGSIRVWMIHTGECVRVLKQDQKGVLCVAWDPSGMKLVAGYTTGCVRLWNVDAGIREIGFLPGHSNRTTSVAWSPDGKRIASASSDKTIRIWTLDNKCERIIRGHTGLGVFAVKWSSDGHILSGAADKSMRIWNPDDGRCEAVFAGPPGLGVYDVAWSGDGRRVVSGSRDRTVKVWNALTGECECVLTGHTNWVYGVAWEKGGKRVASKSDDNTVRLWDVETGHCQRIIEDSGDYPEEFDIESTSSRTLDLSGLAPPGGPVGVQCEKVRIFGERACGWTDDSVYFFKLMGRRTELRAPSA